MSLVMYVTKLNYVFVNLYKCARCLVWAPFIFV